MDRRPTYILRYLTTLIAASVALGETIEYRYYDLGNLGSPAFTEAVDIADSGVVVGSSTGADGSSRAYSWSNGVMSDLSQIWEGGWIYYIAGVSEPGTMIAWGDVFEAGFAALVVRNGSVSVLPWPDGYGQNWIPRGINSAGTFGVGYCETTDGQHYDVPTLYDLEQVSSLALGYPPGAPEGVDSKAYGVNNDGVVVGIMRYPDETDSRAFVWSGGVMTELINTLGGQDIGAVAVNNHGLAAGCAESKVDDFAIQYDLYSGEIQILSEDAAAWEINDRGVAVGVGLLGDGFDPLLFSGGQVVNLVTFFPYPADGTAYAINNYGWVVGSAYNFDDGFDFWGWLLVPIYEKGDFDGDEDVDFQDFGHFQRCFAAEPYIDGTLHVGCSVFDFDDDVDLDLADYETFQAAFTGPQPTD